MRTPVEEVERLDSMIGQLEQAADCSSQTIQREELIQALRMAKAGYMARLFLEGRSQIDAEELADLKAILKYPNIFSIY